MSRLTARPASDEAQRRLDRQAGHDEAQRDADAEADDDAGDAAEERERRRLGEEEGLHLAAARAERAHEADLAVRSPTAIHIMVRMPMAPTRSEMPAIAPTAMVTTSMTLPKTSSIASWVVTVKSSLPSCRAVSSRLTAASTRAVSRTLRVDEVDLDELVEVEQAHRRGDRDVGDVVDVEAEELALRLHHPDDAEAAAADAHELAERAAVAEELARELRPEHRPRARRGAGRPSARRRPAARRTARRVGTSGVTP